MKGPIFTEKQDYQLDAALEPLRSGHLHDTKRDAAVTPPPRMGFLHVAFLSLGRLDVQSPHTQPLSSVSSKTRRKSASPTGQNTLKRA